MNGKVQLGVDYTLSGTPGQVTIPAGQASATVTLHALTDSLKEKPEKTNLTLVSGTGYKVGKNHKHARVTILNVR